MRKNLQQSVHMPCQEYGGLTWLLMMKPIGDRQHTGRDQRCKWCLRASHSSRDCINGAGKGKVTQRLRVVEPVGRIRGRKTPSIRLCSETEICNYLTGIINFKYVNFVMFTWHVGDHPRTRRLECAAQSQWGLELVHQNRFLHGEAVVSHAY